MPVDLHDHQRKAVEQDMHNGCILYGGVGVGKTITSLGYYFSRVCGGTINKWGSMATPKDVYVITTAKVRDSKSFELQAAQYGVHEDPSLSTNGVKITVDSWNNLHKYTETKDAFFIFDEQRVVGYGAWSKAFIKIAKHNEWILLSATPGDTWLDYIPVFIANGWYKHKTDFLDQHVIWTPRVKYPKVLRYQDVGTLVRRRNEVLVHMPYERHTVRHGHYVECDYDEAAFEKVVKKRWHVFENRPLRDVSELFSVMRKVVNSDASRLSAVENLLSKHPKLIVFYNFDYELEILRTLVPDLEQSSTGHTQKAAEPSSSHHLSPPWQMCAQGCPACAEDVKRRSASESAGSAELSTKDPWQYLLSEEGLKANSILTGTTMLSGSEPGSGACSTPPTNGGPTAGKKRSSTAGSFAVAEWNGHKHEEIPNTDRWVYLVQYRAGAEGWNCVETDAICFYSQTYSYRDWWQAHGRIDRLNTPFTDLHYYYLISRSVIDKAIRASLRAKKNFNERDLKVAA